jgi:hypothetical protein
MEFLTVTVLLLALQQVGTDPSATFPGYLGQGGAFTSRFDSSFNPAMSLSFDAVGTVSESDADAFNDARLRLLEMGLASRIDPYGWAYATIAFADEGEESEVELEEGAMWFDDLGHEFSLRGGRFLADFGKWNSVHLHDRAYAFLPGPAASCW